MVKFLESNIIEEKRLLKGLLKGSVEYIVKKKQLKDLISRFERLKPVKVIQLEDLFYQNIKKLC